MLAVVASPHRFTTALTSEASIVPGASYRRITPTACPGRVLGAASQVRSCFVQLSQLVLQLRVARLFPNHTGLFPCHVALQQRYYVGSEIGTSRALPPRRLSPPALLPLVDDLLVFPSEA